MAISSPSARNSKRQINRNNQLKKQPKCPKEKEHISVSPRKANPQKLQIKFFKLKNHEKSVKPKVKPMAERTT